MPIVILFVVLAWPFLEIAAFIAVGQRIGILATIALTLFASAVGAALLRLQGLAVLRQVQREIGDGLAPAASLGHGALIALAALMLMIPGFVSDAVGLLLFLPPVRSLILRLLARNVNVVVVTSSSYRRPSAQRRTVDLDPADWHAGPSAPGTGAGSPGSPPRQLGGSE